MATLPESATKSENKASPQPRFPPPLIMSQRPQMAASSASSSPPPHPPTFSPSGGGAATPNSKANSNSPQLSTPPGPPVFTSPLRPAAVPFRTSPASPQPVAVAFPHVQPPPILTTPSPSSTLPPSSPPSYSSHTASFDLNSISPLDSIAPLVLFSAHKMLKQKKQANVPSLGFGALISPGREIAQGPHVIQRDPHRCQSCGAYPNPYCNVLLVSGNWQCVVCRNLNGSDGEYVASNKEDLRNFPELSSLVVDYVQTGSRLSGFVPVSDSRTTAPIALVIDECLDEPHLQHLQSSLHAFVDSLPPTTRIGIVSYGRTVSVYDFSEDSTASADVLPGDWSPSEDSLRALIYGTGIYLSPVHASLPVAHTIFSSFRPFKANIPEIARDRCLGTAVEVALAIIQGPSADLSRGVVKKPGGKSRIIVCAGGPNTFGPGAVPHSFTHPNYPYLEKTALKWMDHLGREAHRQHTVVDILCAGSCPVRVPVLQPLARASGGVLILHDDFGEVFGVNLQRASGRAAGSHGLLEIRVPDDILITQVVGPGEEAHFDSHENFKNDASVSIQMLSVEETQSFSVFLETKRDIKTEHVFFQFAVQYSNAYIADITRVITVRMPTVDSVSAYLDSVQDDVAAVLIAKRTLLRAKSASEAVNMRLTIDERVKDIALKFGSQVPKSKLYKFPKELSSLPEHLFHLRRGPLLGSIVGHEDERSVLRNLFLDASFDLSLRMIAPRCLMHREGGTFEELPAYDLAMQSDTAVVLDHGTDIFIWLVSFLASFTVASCQTLLHI